MLPPYSKGRRIGLLGGSFNPAHAAHLYLSQFARRQLQLDEIWWLVSPQNPLKDKQSLAAYDKRLRSANDIASGHRYIRVLDIEAQRGLNFTWQTVAFLRQRCPGAQFVWLMGADNLAQFHRWHRWQPMADSLPLAVFDRFPHTHQARRCKSYGYMHEFVINNSNVRGVSTAPALYIGAMPRQALSSTMIRKTLGEAAFLGHNKVAGSY